VLVCDANSESWSSISLGLFVTDNPIVDPLPFNWSTLISKILTKFPQLSTETHYSLLPIRFDAGKFSASERIQRSSTYRERVAILRALALSSQSLSSPLIVVTDNENVTKTWRDIEQTLTAADFTNFERFQEMVDSIIHLKRLHPSISIVDSIARNFIKSYMHSDEDRVDVIPLRPRDESSSDEPCRKNAKVEEDSQSSLSYDPSSESQFVDIRNFIYSDRDINPLLASDLIFKNESDGLYYKKDTNSVLVPSSFRFSVIQHIHDLGHRGIKAMSSLCRRFNFYVPNFSEIAAKITSQCDACNRGKSCHGGPPRGKLPKPSIPFTICALDFLTINDTLKLLVLVDLTSGFIDAIPISEMTGFNTLNAIRCFFYRWGFPSAILTDNGKSFIFDPLQTWLKTVGVTSLLTPLYSPQSNGKCEQAVRSVMDSIRITFLDKRLASIPVIEILPEILYALNSVSRNGDPLAPKDYIFCYKERCPFADTSKTSRSETFKGNFKVGDSVLLKVTNPNLSKLDPRFEESGTILEHVGNYVYLICKTDGRKVKYREDKLRRNASGLSGNSPRLPDEGGGLQ
jgi:hypothetical protein